MQGLLIIAAYVGSILGVTIGIYIYAIEGWLAPFSPVLYLAAFVTIALTVMGAVWFQTTKAELESGVGSDGMSAEQRGFRRLTELTGQFVLATIALLIMLTWAVPQVRAMWVGYIDENPVQLGYALEDPSPVVLLKVCDAIFERGVGPWRQRLADRLSNSPGVASKCITKAIEKNRGAAMVVARMTSVKWASDLRFASEYESFDACEKTKAMRIVDEARGYNPDLNLMRCAFSAQSSTARECCAEASESIEALHASVKPESLSRPEVQEFLPDMLRVAYSPTTDDVDISEAFDLESSEQQKHVMAIACALLDPDEETPEVVESLSRFIAGGTCIPTDAEASVLLSSRTWNEVCFAIEDGRAASREEICKHLNEINVGIAVSVAQLHVSKSQTAYDRLRTAMYLERGIQKGVTMGGGTGKKEPDPRLGDSAVEILGLTSLTDNTCKKIVYEGTGSNPFANAREVISTDCTRFDKNLTYEEYLAALKAKRKENVRLGRNPLSKENRKLLFQRAKKRRESLKESDVARMQSEAKKTLPKLNKEAKKNKR